jgi:hypothetical protein
MNPHWKPVEIGFLQQCLEKIQGSLQSVTVKKEKSIPQDYRQLL